MKKVIFNNDMTGNVLLNLLEENNMTCEKLSSETSINLTKLKRIVNRKEMPDLKETIAICNYFKISIDDFISYEIQ